MRLSFFELDWTRGEQTVSNDTQYPMIVWDARQHIALIESGKTVRFVRLGCNWIAKNTLADSAALELLAA